MSAFWIVLLSVTAGTVLSSVLPCLPGLHIYNVMGAMVLGILAQAAAGNPIPSDVFLPAMTGMVVGWSMLNTIPAVLLGTPDESAMFTVLPGQKYLMAGRGFEGTMITAVGGLAGAFFLVCVMAPLAPRYLPVSQQVLKGHMHWVLWVIITFMLMSEWPKGGNRGPACWAKFYDAWKTLLAGLATFVLAGLLGFILLTRSPVNHEVAFQNIMPAFVGLFAIPWCLLNMISAADVPKQRAAKSLAINGDVILRSVFSGGLGGGVAAYFPVVTGDAFLQSLRSFGAKVVFFVDYVPADPGTESLAPGDAEREALASRLDQLRTKRDGTIYVSFPGDEQYSDGCLAAGRGFFHINPSGGAEPCPFSPVSDTNLRQVSLLEALDSPLFQRLRSSSLLELHHTGACALFGRDDELAALCGTRA